MAEANCSRLIYSLLIQFDFTICLLSLRVVLCVSLFLTLYEIIIYILIAFLEPRKVIHLCIFKIIFVGA